MLSTVKSMSLHGLEGYLVEVQVDISVGIPNWEVVRFARSKCKGIKRKGKNSN